MKPKSGDSGVNSTVPVAQKERNKVLNGDGNMAAYPKALNVDVQYVKHLHRVTE